MGPHPLHDQALSSDARVGDAGHNGCAPVVPAVGGGDATRRGVHVLLPRRQAQPWCNMLQHVVWSSCHRPAAAAVHANAGVAAGFWARSGAAYYHTAKGGYAPTLVPGFGDMTTSLSAGTAACHSADALPLRMHVRRDSLADKQAHARGSVAAPLRVDR